MCHKSRLDDVESLCAAAASHPQQKTSFPFLRTKQDLAFCISSFRLKAKFIVKVKKAAPTKTFVIRQKSWKLWSCCSFFFSSSLCCCVASYENAHWGTPTAERLRDTVHLSCGSTLRTPSMTQWTAPALATALRALWISMWLRLACLAVIDDSELATRRRTELSRKNVRKINRLVFFGFVFVRE